jgi:hypothetical protein
MKIAALVSGAGKTRWRAAGDGWMRLAWLLMAGFSICIPGGGPLSATEVLTPGHVLNISTRGRIGVGDDVMIGGFIIVGETPRRVLVRVLGPSLRQFNVPDAVADPIVRIQRPNSSEVLAENDNWGDGDPAAVIATGLAPFHALDCAMVLDLAPGSYTAIVSGRNGGTGVGLVEVFDLDHPVITGTSPVKNVTAVSATTTAVTVSFDREMAPEVDMEPCAAWGASNYTWSADRQELTITRLSAASILAPATCMTIVLNPSSGSHRMRDADGNTMPTYTLKFTVGTSTGVPYVVSTVPENGAIVESDLNQLAFTFSEPMAHVEGGVTNGYWPYVCAWSTDMKTMTVTRTGTDLLPAGATLYFRVLPPYYKSTAGVPMASSFDLTFTVALNLQRVEADPARGFQWPYFLVVPRTVTAPATLLVEPNNTGTVGDNPAFHEDAALSLVRNKAGFAATLGSPLLVPAFPRPANPPAPEPGGIYTHALDRFCLQMTGCPIERLDLQLLAMVDDARARLATQGINVATKFFMTGFSASGAFTSRFSLLHPDRLKAAACGSPGGWPIAPVSSWNGTTLRYPCGIADVASLVGASPDLATFVRLPLFIYVGAIDTNDAFDIRGMAAGEQTAIKTLLNSPQDPYIANRWPLAEAIYASVGSVAEFAVYPGVAHSYSSEMLVDLLEFFEAHR